MAAPGRSLLLGRARRAASGGRAGARRRATRGREEESVTVLFVALVQELDGHRDGELHDRLLVVVEEDTTHDVGGHLGMRWVTLAGGSKAVGKA